MSPLVAKDLRLVRPVLIGAAALAGLFWVVLPGVTFWQARLAVAQAIRENPHVTDAGVRATAWSAVQTGPMVMWLPCLALFAAVGGMAFAAERRERWADFAAMLPVPRRRAIAAKAAVSVGVCLAIAAANWSVHLLANELSPSEWYWMTYGRSPDMLYGWGWPAAALLAVGLASGWLVSRRAGVGRGGVAAGGVVVFGAAVFVEAVAIQSHLARDWYRGGWINDPMISLMLLYTPLAVAVFGGAWGLSSAVRSPVLAAVVALGAIGGTYVRCLQNQALFTHRPNSPFFVLERLGPAVFAFGIAAFAAGVVVQARRRSP